MAHYGYLTAADVERLWHATTDRPLRLFGSYAEEDDAEPCVYGTRGPLRSWNPVWAKLTTPDAR